MIVGEARRGAWQSAVALAVLVALSPCSAAARGRGRLKLQHDRSRSKSSGFENLVECEVAYDSLHAQCTSSASSTAPDAMGVGKNANLGAGTLVHDEDGDSWSPERRPAYLAPEPGTGKPSQQGWDYRMHGDDWEPLGDCSGHGQSPVDLPKFVGGRGQTKSLLWFDYYSDPDLKAATVAKLINDGHGISMDLRENGMDFGYVKIGHEEFQASEYLFHAPSEHTMDGATFPLELQIFNFDTSQAGSGTGKDGLVGISIFFREGQSNPFLAALRAATQDVAPAWSLEGGGAAFRSISGEFTRAFDLEGIIPRIDPSKTTAFYNYRGSLTQPPCTEGVDWWVLSRPIPASREEIRFLRKAIFTSESMKHGNARSTMPLGNRTILAGQADFQHVMKNGRRMYTS
mmetsp:Transcript_133639/g.236541  ORF Transcript_133639/g.236541 Transcript_133639/m.236541 type:complete len:401 (+) Transcript_133639:136-1338(+)